MKAIMISDKPKWCALMMNGIKTIEVRKNKALASAIQKLIDKYGYAEIYVYCSKDKQGLWLSNGKYDLLNENKYVKSSINGKVVFKFRCYNVEEVKFIMDYIYGGYYNTNSYVNEKCFERDCCLTIKELDNYINKNNLNKRDNVAYALHISNLEIFDRPKELSDFKRCQLLWNCEPHDCINCRHLLPLIKAPQNFCYVEVE